MAVHFFLSALSWLIAHADLKVIAPTASALFAGAALINNARASRSTTTFAMLREAEERASDIAGLDADEAVAEIGAFQCGSIPTMQESAKKYAAFLNYLDRTILLLDNGIGNRRLIRIWLRRMLKDNPQLLDFIEELQRTCNDDSVLEHLRRHLRRERERATRVSLFVGVRRMFKRRVSAPAADPEPTSRSEGITHDE